jgi:hypothetical protein
MRKTSITLVVALASLVPAGAMGDGMVPAPGKTPTNQAPASPSAAAEKAAASGQRVTQADLQPDAPDQYTVQKGDTLWGLAGRFLKDPWRWPQIWQMNQDRIKDPHLIYPGDVIRLDRSGEFPTLALGGSGAGGSAEAAANVVKLEPRVRIESLQSAIPSIPGSVLGPFLSQPLVVDEGVLDTAPSILATQESRVIVGVGDTAYADRIGTNDGINFQVFRAGSALRDPDTNELLGYEAKYVGDARVRRYGHPTTVEITKAREEINRGDRLLPAREVTFPTYVPRAPERRVVGSIMSVDGGVSELGQFQIVTLNRGAREGLAVGHVLASYHRGQEVGTSVGTFETPRWMRNLGFGRNPVVPEPSVTVSDDPKAGIAHAGGTIRLPDERNGLIFVFRVFEKMSYGLVMRSTRPIYVGDIVQNP